MEWYVEATKLKLQCSCNTYLKHFLCSNPPNSCFNLNETKTKIEK
jgi:hypothetical protein